MPTPPPNPNHQVSELTTDTDIFAVLVRTGHFTPIPHGCKPHMRDIKSYGMQSPPRGALVCQCANFFSSLLVSSGVINVRKFPLFSIPFTLLTHVLCSLTNPRTRPPTKSSPG